MTPDVKVKQDLRIQALNRNLTNEVLDQVRNKQNIESIKKEVLSEIVSVLKRHCHKTTGYGARHGIRISNYSKGNIYEIIVGSELPATGGQKHNAPYIAIQNIWEYHTDWINDALVEARGLMRKNHIWVQIRNPQVISKYIRKYSKPTDAGGVSGYSIEVSFEYTEVSAERRAKGIKKRRR
jgi:hypothetical protein